MSRRKAGGPHQAGEVGLAPGQQRCQAPLLRHRAVQQDRGDAAHPAQRQGNLRIGRQVQVRSRKPGAAKSTGKEWGGASLNGGDPKAQTSR